MAKNPQKEITQEMADRLADLAAMEKWKEMREKMEREGWQPG